jgi:hypothetical protein
MNYYFLLCFFALSSILFAQNSDIRTAYRSATESEAKAKDFFKLVEKTTSSDKAEMLAYKGAGMTLLARYEPLTKRSSKVKAGIKWIDDAIAKSPNNIEVRLIRLSVQENLPKMFKYNTHIEADKKFIKDALPKLEDKDLVKMINGYFAEFSAKK